MQPQPHFPSFKNGQNPSTSSEAKHSTEPLSYAEFIVRSKTNVAAVHRREDPSRLPRTEDAGGTNVKQGEPASLSSAPEGSETVQNFAIPTETGVGERSETTQETPTDPTCSRPDPSLSLAPKPVGSGSSIVVSPRQVSVQEGTNSTLPSSILCTVHYYTYLPLLLFRGEIPF